MPALGLHPASRLLAWMGFALITPKLSPTALAVSSVFLLLGYVLSGRPAAFARHLKRIRILLLCLIAIYAFTTPGEAIFAAWNGATWEGLHAGIMQASRLILIVASLSFAIANLSHSALLAGIYVLLTPLRGLGLPLERLSARLWLTLHYAENMTLSGGLADRWRQAAMPAQSAQPALIFEMPAFSKRDGLFAGLCGLSFWLALW